MIPMTDDPTADATAPSEGALTCPKCGCAMRLTAEEAETDERPMPTEMGQAPVDEAPKPKSFQDPNLKWE